MDIKKYIASGILELYALGLLNTIEVAEVDRLLRIHDELVEELEKISSALESYAKLNAIEPRAALHQELLDRIENVQKEEEMDPKMLPLITRHSKLNNWSTFTKPILEKLKPNEPRSVKILTHNDQLIQMLLVSSIDFEWETHDDEHESFLILSGEVLCTIGDQTTHMTAGDFMAIPLHVPHAVKLISPAVTAIVQRQKVT